MFHTLPFQGNRLALRLLNAEDLAAFYRYRSDEGVAKYQGWSVMSKAQAKAFIQQYSKLTKVLPEQWHQLAIASLKDNVLIGDMGIWFNHDLSVGEIGLSITPELQGQGYGSEAIRLVVRWLFSVSAIQQVIANTDHQNIACIGALINAGMQYKQTRIAEYNGEWCTEQLFSLERGELKPL